MEGCGMDTLLGAAWGMETATLLRATPTDFTRELDAIKSRIWAEAGDPPRPAQNLDPDARTCSAMGGGPTIMARYKVQEAARARIAAAQAEWEAAASEETWKAWCATHGIAPPEA